MSRGTWSHWHTFPLTKTRLNRDRFSTFSDVQSKKQRSGLNSSVENPSLLNSLQVSACLPYTSRFLADLPWFQKQQLFDDVWCPFHTHLHFLLDLPSFQRQGFFSLVSDKAVRPLMPGPSGFWSDRVLHVLRTAVSKWWLQRLVDLTVPNKLKLCKRLRTFGAWHITCLVYVIPLTVFPAVSNGMYGKTSLISPLYQVWFLTRDCADTASVAWGLGNQPPLGVPLILPSWCLAPISSLCQEVRGIQGNLHRSSGSDV